MRLYKYSNYQKYVEVQTLINKKKLTNVWVQESTIKQIYKLQSNANKILCHGTRNGAEQKLFKKYYPNAYVIGTEISDTALQFKDTVQHDFHEQMTDWLENFDIVYSNSWDHSYDPEKSLTCWRNQITSSGRLYLEVGTSPKDNKSRESDPLEIYHNEIITLFNKIDLRLISTFNAVGIKSKQQPSLVYVAEKKK